MTTQRTKTVKVRGVCAFGFSLGGYAPRIETWGKHGYWSTREYAHAELEKKTGLAITDCTTTVIVPNRRTNRKGEKP